MTDVNKESNTKLDKINCGKMLKTTNREIKTLNQILDRLVPSDDKHTIIIPGRRKDIEVIPDNLMTYKASIRGERTPAKIRIHMHT